MKSTCALGGGRRGDGRDRGVGGAGFDRAENCVEAARLDRAGDLQLLADGARKIDVEARQRAVGTGKGEGRIFVVGDEADGAQAAQIGPLQPALRVPEVRGDNAAGRFLCAGGK